MKVEISYKRILPVISCALTLVVLAMLGTLGWTLDAGVQVLDCLFPVAILFAVLCLTARGSFSKTAFIVLMLTYALYLFLLRQSVTFR